MATAPSTELRYTGSNARRPGAPACPSCSASTDRIPRNTLDFIVSMLVPVRRYRCVAIGCNWEGRLRKRSDAASRDVSGGSYRGRRPFL